MSDPAPARKPSQDLLRDHDQSGVKQQQFGDLSTLGEDSLAKARKPYTITKQRERWTEEEHQKFLEALKLYGRAWRRIEEHIGTKTAVQIRSHAQKFFCKLEREQATGNILPGTPQDIDIPPPRPKRKPSHPYPRKASTEPSPSPKDLDPNQSGNLSGSFHEELKLFGHTVVVPTATRAEFLGKLPKGAESGEEVEAELEKHPSNASDVSMLGSENDSSNDQAGNRSTELNKDGTPGVADQQQELAALYYSKFWESFQTSDRVLGYNFCADRGTPGFPLWQPAQFAAAAGARAQFPNGVDLSSAFVRSMLAGQPPEMYNRENSPAAFAAATLAAASAWWALQSSVHPGFLPQCVFPAPEVRVEAENGLKSDGIEMPLDDDENQNENENEYENPNASPSCKRLSSSFDEADKRRVRSRSFKEDQPPSSSGSDDGGCGAAAQANADGDASGNSGPSSNSSRCGTAEAAVKSEEEESSSDKEKTEEEQLAAEAARKSAFKIPSFPSQLPAQHNRFRRVQRTARPCRSSGSEGDQRKEVSQEGRMAFQALFSHEKLPQTFAQRFGFRVEQQYQQQQQYARRAVPDSETSDLDSISRSHNTNNNINDINTIKNANANAMGDKTITMTNTISCSGMSSIASERSPVPSILSSAATKCRSRRSGFVPYCRASSGAAGLGNSDNATNPTRSHFMATCGLEDHHLLH